MKLENDRDRYGAVAQILHAAIALLILGSFASIYLPRWFAAPEAPVRDLAFQTHLSIGLSVLVLAGLRLWWRLRSPLQPDHLPGPWWEHAAARIVHLLLYVLILLMPVTGYLGTGADAHYLGLATIPQFQKTALFDLTVVQGLGLSFKEFEKPVDWLHKTLGELMLLVLVSLHVGAALYHQFARRDGILSRMFPASSQG
jgi:cytochrome b561